MGKLLVLSSHEKSLSTFSLSLVLDSKETEKGKHGTAALSSIAHHCRAAGVTTPRVFKMAVAWLSALIRGFFLLTLMSALCFFLSSSVDHGPSVMSQAGQRDLFPSGRQILVSGGRTVQQKP